jgi:uncharacterized protein
VYGPSRGADADYRGSRSDCDSQPMLWPEERIEHIARHRVTPEEVEDVCFGKPWVRRVKSEGENPVYYVLGQTEAGRYLFCVVIRFPDGNGYPVTAREMTAKEKRRYRKWKRR